MVAHTTPVSAFLRRLVTVSSQTSGGKGKGKSKQVNPADLVKAPLNYDGNQVVEQSIATFKELVEKYRAEHRNKGKMIIIWFISLGPFFVFLTKIDHLSNA